MKKSVKHLIYCAVTLTLVFVTAVLQGLFNPPSGMRVSVIICNAFFIIGVLMAGIGILSWAGSKGTYDIFSYAGKVILVKFKPKEKMQSYYDYTQEKNKNRKAWLKELTVWGAICIAISALLIFV
ncbi:MAG: DUF3899 domain-containing protein [Spirochaetales bacterium]|nr:DUF3899 domain-containing protein [Spirochaetales bacterium]MBQ4282027.1 DUF3899 domain-containing protein [Spirochaetales bacterium]MBR4477888.1 DUF3899 domain-containing protein [Spirochaetales bacterium]MBR6235233.1 DUF3899 domain-containing protein [Spirochaetales bacterium]